MKDLRLAVRGLHDGDCVTGRLNVCCCGRVHFGIFILSSSTINATPKGSRTTRNLMYGTRASFKMGFYQLRNQ